MDKYTYVKDKLIRCLPAQWGEIARESGITRQTIANIMGGKSPNMKTIEKLYEHLKTKRIKK